MKKVQSSLKCFLSSGIVLASLLFFCEFPLSAFERIISPASGTWANKQPLVLDTSDGAECFYSYSGTDPLTSGFAYDGPVLIDASDSVTVRVISMIGDKREESEVSYTVSSPGKFSFSESSEESKFINSVISNPVFDCASSIPFVIPSSLSYKMENGDGAFSAGASLSVDPSNKLARCIPCVVTDGNSMWRFVIRIGGGEVGTLSKQNVPFEIVDWTNFIWTGKKLIWHIDDEMWSAKTEPHVLDRSIPHVVSWQSVAYEAGNPVETFVLPPLPSLEIKTTGMGNKPVNFVLNGDARYRMELVSSGAGGDIPESSGLFTEALFDTYQGDEASGTAVFAIYCDGVYQGKLSGSYSIDRKIPASPKIESSSENFYARKSVELKINSEKDAAVYYSVSNPLEIEDSGSSSYSADSELFNSVVAGDFRPLDKNVLILDSGKNNAVFYKVSAYAVDKAGNMSPVSEYKVLIDEYNYWLAGKETEGESDLPKSENNAEEYSDGTMQHPFTTFEQALSVINNSRFSRFHVTGNISLSGKNIDINSNCSFVGNGNARFEIPSDCTVTIRSASFESTGCTFEKQKASGGELQNSALFVLENGVASFDNVEIVGIFGENGTVFSAQKSVIYLSNSGLTAQADTYACGISSVDSKITAKKSRFVTIAQTAVNFSVNGGLFEIRNNDCKVISRLGRIAELVKTNARMSDNVYTGQLEKKNENVKPIWKDEGTLTLEDTGNSSNGF